MKKIAPRSIRRMFPQVKTVIDAKKPIEVHVETKDCKTAQSLDPTNCALARAVKREYKLDAAVIGVSTSYIIKGSKAIRFNTGQKIAREIVSFDRNHDFRPGVYKIVPKSKSVRLGVQNRSKDKRTNHDKATKHRKTIRHNEGVRLLTKREK
jgi:hypothetical protein